MDHGGQGQFANRSYHPNHREFADNPQDWRCLWWGNPMLDPLPSAWLKAAGWQVRPGAEIAPDGLFAERRDFGQVILAQRLRDALARLNPSLPAEALADACRKLTQPQGSDLLQRNRALHRLLVNGVTVEYRDAAGKVRGAQARVVDFDHPEDNDWLAVSQFAVVEHRRSRRPDIVLFVNGLPLVVLELKNPADEAAILRSAHQQPQTYQAEISSLFVTNAVLVISDGTAARIGPLGAGYEPFRPWRTIGGDALADPHLPELQVLIAGLFVPHRLLAFVRDLIVFEDDGSGRLVKKVAGYHQFHAVQVAVEETLRAANLNRRADRLAEGGGGYLARAAGGAIGGSARPGIPRARARA